MRGSVVTKESTMNVRSIFRPWVVRVEGDDCLADAAERMQNEQVG
jgi:hypothetical protein